MSKKFNVEKRNGKIEAFDPEKINQVVEWATQGYPDTSLSDILLHAKLQIHDGISTNQIHQLLIQSAADLISVDAPNNQFVAAKLLTFHLRKNIWGGHKAPAFFALIEKNIKRGVYDSEIVESYSKEEIDYLDAKLSHDRDYFFTYAGVQQLIDKYLVKDRVSGEVFETPQFAYMLISMMGFHKYPKETRLKTVLKFYNQISLMKINLPTPIVAGVRTPVRQFASCCLIDVDDTLGSIFSSNTAMGYYTARRSGIGVNVGRIRPLGAKIRGGEVVHTGLLPFLKMFEATVKSCQQSGIRGGSATVNVPVWHYEIEDVVVLKNNAGTDDNRVRKLDYCIQFSKLFYERVVNNEKFTLFSPNESKELYAAFGHENFDEMYLKFEQRGDLTFKKTVHARELFNLILKERLETGRIYVMNIDHCNSHSPWLGDVKMTNLCVEILQPTTPLQHIDDPNGEIGICILSAINLLECKTEDDIEAACESIVRFLDEIIDYQDYPVKAAENFTKNRRSLGIGLTNLAALLAKNGIKYEDKAAPNFVDEKMETIQFYLLKASNALAVEKGPCAKFNETKYSKGILPIDTYYKNLDKVVTRKPSMDWKALRNSIMDSGLRHSTVSAIMPVESSSVIQNSTNGIEPPRSLLSVKKSRVNTLKQLVPVLRHKNHYTLAYDMENNIGVINIAAALQKWIDMSISLNLYYDYSKFENGNIPLSVIAKEQMYAYSVGIKTLYYLNTNDGDKQRDISKPEETSGCAGGSCSL